MDTLQLHTSTAPTEQSPRERFEDELDREVTTLLKRVEREIGWWSSTELSSQESSEALIKARDLYKDSLKAEIRMAIWRKQ